MENYYSGFGETWERLALIKARGICGSRELAYEFLRLHQPFIYPKSHTRDLLEEVAAIKRRIERDIVGYEKIGRDVKLGAGGIREIEFIVQALQLLHGARHAFLQETSTLKALPLLAELELISGKDARELESAYRFLRTIDHRRGAAAGPGAVAAAGAVAGAVAAEQRLAPGAERAVEQRRLRPLGRRQPHVARGHAESSLNFSKNHRRARQRTRSTR